MRIPSSEPALSRSPLRRRAGSLFLLLAVAWAPWSAPAALAADGVPEEGLYEIEGITTVEATGDTRQAHGRIVLSRGDDGSYTTTYNLRTNLPTPEGSRNVDITGSGEGRMQELVLKGRTESQYLMAAIPGLDPMFAFIPGRLGPRIVSTFEMKPRVGSSDYDIEISSVGVTGDAGAGYSPTTSSFRAKRVGDTPVGKKLPLPQQHDD